MSQWLSRIRTARRATVAAFVLLALLAVLAVQQDWVTGDTAAMTIAAASLIAALFAWDTTGRAADIADQSHRTAEAVAKIERDRWHAEQTPEFEIDARVLSPHVMRGVISVGLQGPGWLHHVDRVIVRIDDDFIRQPPPPGTASPEEVAAQIWGPLRFTADSPGVNGSGRATLPFSLTVGQPQRFNVEMTSMPRWWHGTPADWVDRHLGDPVRLVIECRVGEYDYYFHRVVPVHWPPQSP